MKSSLKALAQLILHNVEILEADCEKRGIDVPSLEDVFTPGSDIINEDPAVLKASHELTSAAYELANIVRPTHHSLFLVASGALPAAALRCASELNIAEILKEAGPSGLHLTEIAKQANADPQKLAPVLRVLSSQWIFKEVKPDVFANNRLSSVLDKGKSVADLQHSPETKYAESQSAGAALLGHVMDEGAKSAAYLSETLLDPETAFSGGPTKCSLQRAFNTEKTIFDWFEDPDQKHRLYRFGVAMEGAAKFEPPELALNAFEWSSISDGALVVDVGGGVGACSVQVAKKNPTFKFVVQDRVPVIADGEKRLAANEVELWRSNRLTFQGHDFFAEQPIKNADVFFMKFILHDWPDEYALNILRKLREAATPTTKLFVLDKVMPYTCAPDAIDEFDSFVPGAWKTELTAPLTNVIGGSSISFISGLLMLLYLQGQERTLGHFVSLLKEAGWKVVKVQQFDALGQVPSGIHAVPA
ncbi:S-adenosyl-L-methionine-dependent methyltransferase [Schizopora paradoxa]|uniref:S-adenosyl-L-methionine-dependent methyltransferase n=1 Tax=Schizopora paradoxa TaxID=27342 RepID=A0A0H2RYX3_9AGAM|nr:S-adenosyl-L-methionine-dependent methyltransferase [Schizopora paradoxa]